MGLAANLATATSLKAALPTDGALASIIADAGTLVADLQAQLTALTGDLTGYQNLLTSLTANGANAGVLADCNKVITDLQTQTA